jgi:GDP-L-fucose synthase
VGDQLGRDVLVVDGDELRCAAPQAPVVVWGTGRATRDFLFVDDAARALILAAERADGPLSVNVGSGTEYSIAEVVTRIAALTGFRGEVAWDPTRPDGQARRRLDVTRARSLLGFEPTVSLEEGLRPTVAAFGRDQRDPALSRRAVRGRRGRPLDARRQGRLP